VTSLCDSLAGEGYSSEVVDSGEEAVEAARASRYSCLIFDLGTRGKHAFDVCRELRSSGDGTPIVLLTPPTSPVDGVIGLRLGADDYMAKPVAVVELLARLEALRRRCSRPAPIIPTPTYSARSLSVNFRTCEVRRDGDEIHLTALERKLLWYLIEHRGKVVTRDELLDHVWGYNAAPVTRTVDVRVAALRRKLEADPEHPEIIVTIHGHGYRLADDRC
jgi:DNA-binding response OmpR family regulator